MKDTKNEERENEERNNEERENEEGRDSSKTCRLMQGTKLGGTTAMMTAKHHWHTMFWGKPRHAGHAPVEHA